MISWKQDTLFLSDFKLRVQDEFVKKWFSSIRNSNQLIVYKELKQSFEFEDYLLYTSCRQNRVILTKLRISAHSLRVETGRYASRQRLDRNQRICNYCNKNVIEDEYHFIMECQAYDLIRKKYIKKYYITRSNMFKLVQLFTSSKRNVLNLSKYLNEAFKIRNSLQIA